MLSLSTGIAPTSLGSWSHFSGDACLRSLGQVSCEINAPRAIPSSQATGIESQAIVYVRQEIEHKLIWFQNRDRMLIEGVSFLIEHLARGLYVNQTTYTLLCVWCEDDQLHWNSLANEDRDTIGLLSRRQDSTH
jgi:hypothetical protein